MSIQENVARLQALVAEVHGDKDALVRKCGRVMDMVQEISDVLMREHPEVVPQLMPMLDQLKSAMAGLTGSLQ